MSQQHIGAYDEAPWRKFVSRWALVTASVTGGLLFTYMVVLGFDSSVPEEYAELVQASRNPAAFRIASMLSVLLALAVGGLLVGFGGLLARRAPIRAALIAAVGAGQAVWVLDGFATVYAVGELAARYSAAATEQQPGLVQTYLASVVPLHLAHTGVGALLTSVGFLLVASAGVSLVGLPLWLRVWMALSGVYGLGEQVLFFATGTSVPFFPFDLLVNVIGGALLFVAIAATLWRPTPEPVSRLAVSPAS